MSDYRAIQGVSSTLKVLIEDRLHSFDGEEYKVIIAPPDKLMDEGGKIINLFLYRVMEDAYLKNEEIPGTGYPADYGHPPLSLDLHYLITVFNQGNDETEAQQVLGDVMRILHDYPIITNNLFKIKDPGVQVLDLSIQNQFEWIKVNLEPISLEDITKIWTALTKPFRLSVAYSVSAIQIESRQERRIKRQVGEPPFAGPHVYAVPFISPRIEEVRVIRKDDPTKTERKIPVASIGDTLVITGSNFQGDTPLRVILGPGGGAVGAADITSQSDERIEVAVPDMLANDERADIRLPTGPRTVEVVRDIKMGEPPTDHVGFRSNQAPFLLAPGISLLTPHLDDDPKTLRIEGSRLYDTDRNSMALIDDALIPQADYLPDGRKENVLEFKLPAGLKSGKHAVRVRVNGVENVDRYLSIP